MKIIIKETNETKELNIIDPNTGIEYTEDFVGNAGAFSDGLFVWDDELCAYKCDQSTYDWWVKVIADHQALEDRIYKLKQGHGYEAVDRVLRDCANTDMDQQPSVINQALDEAFGAN